jgi:glutamate transport system permease protein
MSAVLYDEPGPQARKRILLGSIVGGVVLAAGVVWLILKLDSEGIFDAERWDVFSDAVVWESFGKAWWATVRAAGVAGVLALLLAVVLAVWRMAKNPIVRVPGTVVVELLRGMPLLILILFLLLGFGLTSFRALVLGLTLYNGAIIAEILRAGINSLPAGQSEAAYAIGLTRGQTLRTILLPQAVRRMLPSIISQLVVLLKDTSLGFIVAYVELLRTARLNADFYGSRYIFSFFFVAAGLYIVTNFALSRVAVWLERRGTIKAAGRKPAVVTSDATI